MVPFHALYGGVDDFDVGAVLFNDAIMDSLNRLFAGFGIADDAAFADVATAGFELGFDEDDGGAMPRPIQGAEGAQHRRKDQRSRDEGDVHCEKRWSGRARQKEFSLREEACVGALAQGDTRVVAELLGDLAVAGIDGENGGGSALEHAVGEAPSRSSYVDAGKTSEVDGPVSKRPLKLESAAAHIFEIRPEEANDGLFEDGSSGLVDALVVDKDAAGEDESLGALAGGGVTLIHEKLVEADLHRLGETLCEFRSYIRSFSVPLGYMLEGCGIDDGIEEISVRVARRR